MPYIPHTQDEIESMCEAIGIATLAELFDEVPKEIPRANLDNIPEGINEWQMKREIYDNVPAFHPGGCFVGAGAYEHHIPSIVWEVARRGEFYTAYTPYQAEASQGSLQLIYEYQSMIANLMATDVSNASMYDGATALAEAILMAIRIKRHAAKRVIIPANLHPHYRQVLKTILQHQQISLEEMPYHREKGTLDPETLKSMSDEGLAAIVISQPNFFGGLEEVDQLTDIAHQFNTLVIAQVNPIAMALLKPPGQWGATGADIICGEGQPLGIPLASGGPYFGFMACKKEFVRQLPGRIVGQTTDKNGNIGYTLTLQAREQHIRRAKATSNICTNQGLMVTAAAVYLSVMGAKGLRQVAMSSHKISKDLYERLLTIEGVSHVFTNSFFHEFVIRVNKPVDEILEKLAESGIQAGFPLKNHFPELGDCLLVCATETKNNQDLLRYQQMLAKVLGGL